MTSKYNSGESLSPDPMIRLGVTQQNRFIVNNASHPHPISRYHGGAKRNNHPYISGYWYFLVNPPERLFGAAGSNTYKKARDWLFTTAEGFTPPNRTLSKVQVPGMGGMHSNYISGQDVTQTFSITFREYQELPIFNILQTWTSVMDPNTGVSPLAGDEYVPANYKGSAFVALCKPTVGVRNNGINVPVGMAAEDIEQVFYFDGVYPEGVPHESLGSDISTIEGLQIPVSFSFDGFPLLKDSPGVVEAFLASVNEYFISDTYKMYVDSINQAESPTTRMGFD